MSGQRILRIGFTLIEMLIVVTIIAVLLALTAIFFPNFSSQSTVAGGADTTAAALLVAKMRASRDGRPTGLRLTVPNGSTQVHSQLAAHPAALADDYAVGSLYRSSARGPDDAAGHLRRCLRVRH